MPEAYWILPFLLVVAFLYASVGHAGASGYIAVMGLAGLSPLVIKPSALVLNVVVASLTTFKFYRAGHFSWRIFGWFAVGSVPLAYLGGGLKVDTQVYKLLVGLSLLGAAAYLLVVSKRPYELRPFRPGLALPIGAVVGLISGLTGVGGGIFLSPLLFFTRWAAPRTISGISAMFILVNSLSGLAGLGRGIGQLPLQALPFWLGAVLGGAYLGAEVGVRKLSETAIKVALAVVLVIAGVKLIFY
ncbi:MAG: sulfite exporter TauE/SafE family protein [Bernardetiaceae bacterium]|jgi:hypothetical protein|nr:sulfite exporter TauE/SafE family protein [Bernardetiaceae bacterium]